MLLLTAYNIFQLFKVRKFAKKTCLESCDSLTNFGSYLCDGTLISGNIPVQAKANNLQFAPQRG